MKDLGDLELMLQGYGLTTAKFIYRMPDPPHLLQTFIWQHYDLAPQFPELHRFIDFWRREIEGPLHSVTYTHKRLISPGEWRNVTGELILH
jgi:Usg protein, probable subunit of phosphoribosylanthranilate isomerase